MEVQMWPIEKLIFYARNPRKNDKVVDRMVASLREFGFKIPVLARSDGEVVDGHLRLKAARKLEIREVPVILCDEWSLAQVKAFRLLVNRSVSWADWDEELLALELQDLSPTDIDLSLTGFDQHEIDNFLSFPKEQGQEVAPPLPDREPYQTWGTGVGSVRGNATTEKTPTGSACACWGFRPRPMSCNTSISQGFNKPTNVQ